MRSKYFEINSEQNKKLKVFAKGAAYAGVITACAMCFSEVAYAKFDIDAGVKAATDPIINGIKTHWGKAVMMSGGGAALFGEGDGRQRALRAAIASGAAGAVILGMTALLI